MSEGMEVDKVAVEFGDIEMLRGNEYLVEDTPQSAADDKKMEEMVLELLQTPLNSLVALEHFQLTKAKYFFYGQKGRFYNSTNVSNRKRKI